MKLKTLIDYSKRWVYDELYTPNEAIEMILPYIPENVKTIRECTAIVNSNITLILKNKGYKVITTHIENWEDFLEYEPKEYDIIITNPPYSLKDKFIKRAYELWKPFMFLLPLTALEGKNRSSLYNKNWWIQLLIPNKRFNFIKEKKWAWFQTSWFCWKINLSADLNFITLSN